MSSYVTDGDEPAKALETKHLPGTASIRMVPSSESATRRPRFGSDFLQMDRLVLLPKLAFYALWDGHGESFVVPRATTGGVEVALAIGSYTSAPGENLNRQEVGTDITGFPPATVTDLRCRPAPCPACEKRVELQPGDWQSSLAWQLADVHNTAHAAQEAATSSARLPSSPSSTSSSSTTPFPAASVLRACQYPPSRLSAQRMQSPCSQIAV